ncbi:hypothetical protein Bca4012_072130 [Brassica carinata]
MKLAFTPNGVKPGDVGGIDLILLDDKGDRIQACIRRKLISKFKDDLGEGKCCILMNFKLSPNLGNYRGTPHPFKIFFTWSTHVKKNCEEIPNDSLRFNCISFDDLLSQKHDEKVFVDVIGEIVGPCDLKEITVRNAPCKILNLQLKDCGEVIQLIHKSAYELLEQQVQFNSGNEFPRELLALEGRKFVFTVNKPETSKNYTPSTFKVVNVTDDHVKILRFHSDDANETDIPAIGPHFSNSTKTTLSLVNDVFEESNTSISASTESTSTPTKKRASTLGIEDCVPQLSSKKLKGDVSLLAEEAGQLSSTKSKPKVGHVTKDDFAKPSSTKQRKAANIIPKKEKN